MLGKREGGSGGRAVNAQGEAMVDGLDKRVREGRKGRVFG